MLLCACLSNTFVWKSSSSICFCQCIRLTHTPFCFLITSDCLPLCWCVSVINMKFPRGMDAIPVSLSGTRNITFSFHLFVHNSLPSKLNYRLILCIEESTAKTSQSGAECYGILYVCNPTMKNLVQRYLAHIQRREGLVSYVTMVTSFCHWQPDVTTRWFHLLMDITGSLDYTIHVWPTMCAHLNQR